MTERRKENATKAQARPTRRPRGTIVQRGPDRFLIRWTHGGVKESRVVTGTKREAEAQLRSVLASLKPGAPRVDQRLTVGDWIDRWLVEWSGSKAPATVLSYRRLAKLLPASFRGTKLRDVSAASVQAMLSALGASTKPEKVAADGSPWTAEREHAYRLAVRRAARDAQPLGSPRAERRRRKRLAARPNIVPPAPKVVQVSVGGTRTTAAVRVMIRAAFARAVRLGLMTHNPASGEHIDAPVHRPRERRSLTGAEAEALMSAALEHSRGAFVVVSMLTGARPGEVRALTWDDVDGDRLTIRAAMSPSLDGGQIRKGTKTNQTRTVSLPPIALTALSRERVHQQEQQRLCKLAGFDWPAENYIFSTSMGGPYDDPGARRRLFDPVVVTARLAMEKVEASSGVRFDPRPFSGVSPYSLRHSAATMIVASGAPISSVQRLLGHASPTTTIKNYIHAGFTDVADAQQQLAARFQHLAGPGSTPSTPSTPASDPAVVPITRPRRKRA